MNIGLDTKTYFIARNIVDGNLQPNQKKKKKKNKKVPFPKFGVRKSSGSKNSNQEMRIIRGHPSKS